MGVSFSAHDFIDSLSNLVPSKNSSAIFERALTVEDAAYSCKSGMKVSRSVGNAFGRGSRLNRPQSLWYPFEDTQKTFGFCCVLTRWLSVQLVMNRKELW